MEDINKNKAFVDEEESNFDIMEWVANFIHYWYLFVLGVLISLGAAYLQNRKVLPTYKTAGRILIEEFKASNNTQVLMQGFAVQPGYNNIDNQVIMLKSYDLIGAVVDSMPQLKVDYLSIGKFKVRNLYKTSPIVVDPEYISPEAYNLLFKMNLYPDGTYKITVDNNKDYSDFVLKGKIGEAVTDNMFFITVKKTDFYNTRNVVYFNFRTRSSLINDFMSRIQYNYVRNGSSVLEVSLVSETPSRDIDFINKLADTYLSQNLEKKNDAANKTIQFIDSQLKTVSDSLEVSQNEMNRFKQKNNIIDVANHTQNLIDKSTDFDNQLSNLKLREIYLNYLTNYLKTNLNEGAVIAPATLGLNEPMLMSLIQQINDLNIKRGELSPKNFYYSKYTHDIQNVKDAITEVLKNLRASLDIEKNEFDKRKAEIDKQIAELPEKEITMTSIDRRYKMDNNYYTYFLQKRAEAEILKSSNTPDNEILERARVVGVTNGNEKSKTQMMYFLFGFLIPAIFVVIKELINGTVRSAKDVERNAVFKLVGLVRHTQTSDPLIVAKNPRSSFTEMFRIIRTRVEFLVQRKKDIMVMVTSGESGDGKTYFAINLACIYAMASPKTILVDMDIRKPSINKRLNFEQKNGVTNYLVGQCELDDIIMKMPGVDFDILPSGTIPPNSGELIRSEKLNVMLKELRRRYDYVIIDTSPIGIVADAYPIALQVDLSLFIVRNEKTNKTYFKKLTHQLKSDNIKNVYTIINDIKIEKSKYSKYYSKNNSYRYGYGYGYGYTSGFKTRSKRERSEKYFQYYQDDRDL